MYREIDELVDAIVNSDVYLKYKCANDKLTEDETKALLMKHQALQEEYLELRKYEKYISNDEIKNKLKKVKKRMIDNQNIQEYYINYHELQSLLEEVTKIVFKI